MKSTIWYAANDKIVIPRILSSVAIAYYAAKFMKLNTYRKLYHYEIHQLHLMFYGKYRNNCV